MLCQMVPAMHMVATSRFRYSAPLVPWRDAELVKLHAVRLQVERAAWRLPLVTLQHLSCSPVGVVAARWRTLR